MDPLSHDLLAALHQKWTANAQGLSLAEFFSRGMNGAQRDEIEAKFGRTVAELAAEIESPPVMQAVVESPAEEATEPEATDAETTEVVAESAPVQPKRRKRAKS